MGWRDKNALSKAERAALATASKPSTGGADHVWTPAVRNSEKTGYVFLIVGSDFSYKTPYVGNGDPQSVWTTADIHYINSFTHGKEGGSSGTCPNHPKFADPLKGDDRNCPLCHLMFKLRKSSTYDKDDKDHKGVIDTLQSTTKFYANVILLKTVDYIGSNKNEIVHEDPNVQIGRFSYRLGNALIDRCVQKMSTSNKIPYGGDIATEIHLTLTPEGKSKRYDVDVFTGRRIRVPETADEPYDLDEFAFGREFTPKKAVAAWKEYITGKDVLAAAVEELQEGLR